MADYEAQGGAVAVAVQKALEMSHSLGMRRVVKSLKELRVKYCSWLRRG